MKVDLAGRKRLKLLLPVLLGTVFIFITIKAVISAIFISDPLNGIPEQTVIEVDRHDFLMHYVNMELDRKQGQGDIFTFANKLRLYKKLRAAQASGLFPEDGEKLVAKLHDHLFRWAIGMHRSVEEYRRSFSGRGYVICAGGKYVKLAIHTIKVLRLLGSHLPVEVFYNGKDDMNDQQHAYLKTMKSVRVVDLQSIFDTEMLGLKTWDIKPFALLASSFAEAMLMDADTVFVNSPEDLYDDPGYVSTGTAFFYDRTLFGYIAGNQTAWINKIVPEPLSRTLKLSRMYNQTTNYEQEAGVVLIDKSRRLFGMLATCRLNFPDFKPDLHKFTHGDKESFWLGMELANEPYYFIPTLSGSVGLTSTDKEGNKQICGKAAHFDRNERLLWFNDGIVENKHAGQSDPSNIQFYAIEGKWNVLCLQAEPKPIDAGTKMNIHKILSRFERDPLEMSNPQDGQAMFLLGAM